MSHRDSASAGVRLNVDLLKSALLWLLAGVDWSPIDWRRECTWSPRLFAITALLWAYSDEATLVERFRTARKIALLMFFVQEKIASTYQAFTKVLVRWTPAFVQALGTVLRQRMQRDLAAHWRLHGFVVFAADGTKLELPRTRSNQRNYAARSAAKRRHRSRAGDKKANTPQLYLTTVWHVGSGLPWIWRSGASDASERDQVSKMLDALPADALLALDAGFVGYDFLRGIIDSGREVLLRVGSNVRLLQQLGFAREKNGTVYLWPERAQKHQPPLVLRLLVAHSGREPVHLVTSVLQERQLSDRNAVDIYRRRWGVELYYRSFKQTFQRRKLRSAAADTARVEMEWSMLALWSMSLYALARGLRDGVPPRRLSCAKVLRSFRRMLRDYRLPIERGSRLCDLLREAVVDTYKRRNKTSRDYPRKKYEKLAGRPVIHRATRAQRQLAQSFQRKTGERLTA